MTKISLAQAIKRGIPLVAATDHMVFRFDATGREWARQVAHKKPLLGADALGTALVGLAGDVGKAIEAAYNGPDKSPLRQLYGFYPELVERRLQCPDCLAKKEWSLGPTPRLLVCVLRHLQDDHKYSRAQVAQFLERLR